LRTEEEKLAAVKVEADGEVRVEKGAGVDVVPVLGRALLWEVLEGGVQRPARGGGVVDVQGDVLGSQAARAFHLQLDSEGLVPEVDDKVVEPTTAEVDEGAAPTEVEEKRVVADLRPEKPAFTDLALREVGAVDAVALKATGATTEEATTDAIPAEMLE
jgi:hypothetical protein